LADLVGPPADATKYAGWRSHPRILTRWDYAKVAEMALHSAHLGHDVFADCSNAELLRQHFRRRPFNSSFKLPELAGLVGKDGFGNTRILIDDHSSNIKRFHRSGRTAIHAIVDEFVLCALTIADFPILGNLAEVPRPLRLLRLLLRYVFSLVLLVLLLLRGFNFAIVVFLHRNALNKRLNELLDLFLAVVKK